MSLFKKRTVGFMNEIRCDEPSYLIWKWHPSGVQQGVSHRENAIRWGSSLRVKEGEAAVFVYSQENGSRQDFIIGPHDQIIDTKNFPVLASIVGLAYDGGTPFQAEVYFINLAQIVQVKFGVPYFDVFDPRFTDFAVPIAVRGTITFKIADCREFVKLHRLHDFNLEDFKVQIRDVVSRYVKDVVTSAPAANNIPVIQIESKISQINDVIELNLSERLREDFGVLVSGIDISAIEIDKSSTSYAELMAITQDVTSATIKAKTEAEVKNIIDKQRIEIENYEESLRIQREEGQYAIHKGTQTSNLAAFQVEKQAEVGIAGAEALGQMGANGGSSVNLGGAASFDPAAMMAGMAVGGAIGQNIAGTMNNMMAGVNTPPTIPPVPVTAYHVAINGQAAGPFDINALKQMKLAGQISIDSLVWTTGMADWTKAGEVEALNILFNEIPPIPNK